MRTILKVGKKGVIVLPKAFREKIGIEEGDEVLVEVVNDTIVLKPLKPRIVDIDPNMVSSILAEERGEWEERLDRAVKEISS
ncbi:transcriptional regulator/antitoxin, MazE [Ignisphaera aggregans DSM 17230]|uniref:Transcriptional regulator/antitoxin, MazE n=1 Tax=Ignisphaera aggregans (strain DSM 17230 / JCM 13409 / AQ1.S1) TaxID=583356 RepID=E0SP14_IGNAA|nr:transcriptional regulator/antitoxin, MazE [Ignisphaera aggregans DSM 17230]